LKEYTIPTKTTNSQPTTARLQVIRKAIQAYITLPIVVLLEKTHVTPNAVTLFGLILIIVAAILAGTGHLFAAGWVVLVASICDMIDGALARHTNKVTRFGGMLDSTLDRLSEAVILIGIIAYYLFYSSESYRQWLILLIAVTMIASFLVSYIRAKAEALHIECQVGIFTRPERVIILALGLLMSRLPFVLSAALGIIALLSIVTVIQRLACVYQRTKE
jgi:CDP-diacylglycerol---glycerol-3-phosphate 3-phosphatidyltransferase